ncbi:MAG TPA: protein kinase [Anaerolineales bacterium]|nr:protein kinase [Anaerolineales bacterium]
MPFAVGENVGPYRIVEQLGQGGMATVFKAYHASLDRYVAIKALHPAFHQDASFALRFQREARVIAKLEHPNIVPVYDYAEHENRPYLVMKFIEGETLKARLDKGPLSSEEILRIVDAVGSALAYAHKQGVLHRDVKPSNVLLGTDGQIYLADFGLARMAQSGESTLSSDMIMGTPQYISPEQAMGMADLDQRTDLYSFGVMLYEMVVGKVPFNADTPFSIIHDHIYTPLPMPRAVNPNISEAVERVLLKSLAKERADRFEDAAQMVEAFKSAWGEAEAKAQVASAPQTIITVEKTAPRQEGLAAEEKAEVAVAVSRSEKKRPVWMWISAGLALLLCVGFFALARSNRLFARLITASRSPLNPPAPESVKPPLFTATASNSLQDHPPSNVLDGNPETIWSSGENAPQWIQIDLGDLVDVEEIVLDISQSPSGETVHQIWVGAKPRDLNLVHVFKGHTVEPQVLVFKPQSPLNDIRYIRVVTMKSPSLVAWKEIQVKLSPSP